MRYREIIVVSGPDGSGKSTIAKILKMELRKRGYPVYYTWLRYPRFISLLPLFVSKLVGTTINIRIDNICEHVFHAYYKVPILGRVYELAILIDYLIYKFFKVFIPRLFGFIVVVDRGLLDILIDVYVETKRFPELLHAYLGRESRRTNSSRILVMASYSILTSRRRDNLCNHNFRKVCSLYKLLGHAYGYRTFSNETQRDLEQTVNVILSDFNPVRVYSDPKNDILRALFYRHKWLIILSNLVFQCIGYMWHIELALRVVIQVLLIITLVVMLNLNLVVAVIVSHLLLYPLYSNPLDILKWVQSKRKVLSPETLNKLILKLNNIKQRWNLCIDIYIVGSLSRNPCKILLEGADMDARITPQKSVRCVLLSLIIALYVRFWGLLHGIPMDIYVKPLNDPELEKSISLTEFVSALNTCRKGSTV
jgi:energy-coupling factor transporter ATP-binding protein EcfA2